MIVNQSDREAKIREYDMRIAELNNEIADLKTKEELCQSIIGRMDSAIGELYNAKGGMTEIVGNLDNALMATPISKNNIDAVKDVIINVGISLMHKLSTLVEKEEEIQKEIIEKEYLRISAIAARDSL